MTFRVKIYVHNMQEKGKKIIQVIRILTIYILETLSNLFVNIVFQTFNYVSNELNVSKSNLTQHHLLVV